MNSTVLLEAIWKRRTQDGDELLRLGTGLPSTNMSKETINLLALGQAKQLRLMHIGFGSLSCFMALLVIIRVWYDSWRAHQLCVRLRPRRWAFLYDLHPAESFPLVLGFVIMFQELAFVGIQAKTMSRIFVGNCRDSGSLVFAEIFVLGWFHLTFGLDMTIRSLRPQIIAPRRMISIFVCTVAALVLSTAGWLSTKLQPPANRCYGDMIFRSIRSAWLGVSLCVIMIPSFLLMALIIGIRLNRTVLMDHNERIAGTRMVYYLVLSAVIYILILPFWIQAIIGTFDSHLTSSRIAEFVLFISGTIVALVHFFLRANAARTAIRPKCTPWGKRRRLRFFGPSDLELMTISPPILKADYEVDEKIGPWNAQDVAQSKLGTLPSPTSSIKSSTAILPVKPQNVVVRSEWQVPEKESNVPIGDLKTPVPGASGPPMTPTHRRNQASYSLFPGADDIRLPPTTYSPEKSSAVQDGHNTLNSVGSAVSDKAGLREPVLLHPEVPFRTRSNSTDSTATLHIGMRFSSAPSAVTATHMAAQSRTKSQDIKAAVSSPIADPFADKPLPKITASPLGQHPLHESLDSASPITLSSRYYQDSIKQVSPSLSHEQQRRVIPPAEPADYAWLEIGDVSSPAEPLPTATVLLSRPQMLRKESQRQLAEVNRQDLSALERSASSSKLRSRPVYPTPGTPETSVRSEGFF